MAPGSETTAQNAAPQESREQTFQLAYNNEFFPLCLDSFFYGNESRLINHSCEPNI